MKDSAVKEFDLEEAIRVLESMPGVLRVLLEGLPEVWLTFADEPGAWDPRTVVVHYIHNEQVNWMVRARVILSGDEVRSFPPFQQLPDLAQYERQSVRELLKKFSGLRAQTIAKLRGLKLLPADYSRTGEHPVLGTVNLGQLLSAWVVHDLNHLHQIAKTMARRYADDVGPWRRNLAILDS